ncbi:hypothetical protein CEY12_20420 [Chryseobacterium sp. T16E-39]|uniref:hypothetical protein n=1 Tax=Chryseobacterium sp. T16E-39 TaxID=2015076 RepID=UPI000B5B3751|nr:hypothetical protein [Chryseobacterium sp. T16E-39]ASK32304.1 hypothetical protein CEY12_20420 [Chryseobacterium sp. T16E-39]
MILFNIILALHFIAFLVFIIQLALLFPKENKVLHKRNILIGVTILLTGILLVVLKYPHINLYKIIPKSILFLGISTFCGIYSGKSVPTKVFYLLFGMAVLASLIGIIKT